MWNSEAETIIGCLYAFDLRGRALFNYSERRPCIGFDLDGVLTLQKSLASSSR